MEERAHAVLLKYPGTNCDAETARALQHVGFSTEIVPVADLEPSRLEGAALVVLSGGFSYGDYVMAGRLAQLETERRLGDRLRRFRDEGGYLLGICNGFQILTRLGILPPGSLIHNRSGRFQCQWAELERCGDDSPFLQGLPTRFELPVAHAEGRFVTRDPADAEAYVEKGLAALTYVDDINGSSARIAGLQDESGRAFGLMPHPERFLYRQHHYDPDWQGDPEHGWGYLLFSSLHQAVTSSTPTPA